MSPLVSVVTPTHDRAHLLGRALRSALAQTLREFELIVVDDASRDDPGRVIGALGDPRIRLIRLSERGGAGRARNAGLRAARGEHVAFLDSDDEYLPSMLERLVARLRGTPDPARAVAYCPYVRRDALTGRTGPSRRAMPEGPVFAHLVGGWTIPTSTAVLARAFVLDSGGFDESLPTNEDYELWLRLAQASAHFAPVPEAQVVLHHHEGPQRSADPAGRLQTVGMLDARWGPSVRAAVGAAGYERWMARHRAAVQRARFMRLRELVARGERRAAWREWGAMLRDRRSSHRYLVQASLLLGTGAAGYGALARVGDALRGAHPGR